MFACTDKGDRDSDLHQCTCLGCGVVFCENQGIKSDSIVEDLGLADGVLACCRIDDKDLLLVLRLDPVADDLVDLLELLHQVLLVVHSSCCVAEDQVVTLCLCT